MIYLLSAFLFQSLTKCAKKVSSIRSSSVITDCNKQFSRNCLFVCLFVPLFNNNTLVDNIYTDGCIALTTCRMSRIDKQIGIPQNIIILIRNSALTYSLLKNVLHVKGLVRCLVKSCSQERNNTILGRNSNTVNYMTTARDLISPLNKFSSG